MQYGIDDVRGVSNTKEIMLTRANISDRALDRFYIVHPKEFVFNRRTTRMGERLGLGFNDTDRAFIFTEDYVAFSVKESAPRTLLPEYLHLFFLRDNSIDMYGTILGAVQRSSLTGKRCVMCQLIFLQ